MKNFLNYSLQTREAFNEDFEKFKLFNQLLTDTGLGILKSYSDEDGAIRTYTKEEQNAAIRAKFNKLLNLDEHSKRKEIRKAIRRHKVDIFEVIEETVENLLVSGWGDNPFFYEFVEMKNLSTGDENEFYVDDDSVLTVSELAGNHHDIIRQRLGAGRTFKVSTSWYGIKIYAEFELFMAGHVDWAKFVQKIYEAFDEKMNSMVYKSLMEVGDKLPAQPQFNKTGALTAETKETLLTLISDVKTATGYEVVIMGTRPALSKLTALADVNWISDSMKNERHTTGGLALWEGIRLVEIPEKFAKNDTTKKLTNNTKLLIMPLADNKFIKVVNEGEAVFKEVTESSTNHDMTIEYEYQQKMGVATIINMLFGVWTIAT